jgi:hypothetical protein
MRIFLLLCAFVVWNVTSVAQALWSTDIAPILYENCTSCHRDNGIAPFSLMTYNEAFSQAFSVLGTTQAGVMPPWPPDTTYQSYTHERVLNAEEIALIAEWVNGGMPQGDPGMAPPPPVYSDDGFISSPPDLELIMPEHTSGATMMADDYSCFAIPTELLQDKKLRAYEVIPGNPAIVHHALVFVDPTATYPTNTSGNCMGPQDGLFGGYTPGAVPGVFPSDGENFNLGVSIPAGSNIVLAMHYPHGSQGMTDQTKIRLWFYPDETPIREVLTASVIQSWSFMLPANQITEVTAEFNTIPVDISVFSVFPHMHLLGKSIQSHGISPDNDTIPFIRINHWDFHWQQFYAFRNLVRVPANSTMYGSGIYDNTTGNMHNPNNPPQDVFPGLNTTDEMFLIYFQFLPYMPGDELIDLEELSQMPGLTNIGELHSSAGVHVFPNPARNQVQFELTLQNAATASIYLYDLKGQLVDQILHQVQLPAGVQQVPFNVNRMTKGVYIYSVNMGGEMSSGKLVVD